MRDPWDCNNYQSHGSPFLCIEIIDALFHDIRKSPFQELLIKTLKHLKSDELLLLFSLNSSESSLSVNIAFFWVPLMM